MNMALEVPDPKEVTVGQYRELTKLEVNEDLKIRPKRIHFFEVLLLCHRQKYF